MIISLCKSCSSDLQNSINRSSSSLISASRSSASMATATLLRSIRRRSDLPSASISAYRSLSNNSKQTWNSALPPLNQSGVKSSRPFSSAAAGAKKSSLQPGTLETTIAKLKASISGDNSVKEIMADYVHHEVTRTFIMVNYTLFLTIVTKDVLVALAF